MHTFRGLDATIINVTPPNTLYSFCYNPISNKNTFSKKDDISVSSFFRVVRLAAQVSNG